jgi:hypothetical protein
MVRARRHDRDPPANLRAQLHQVAPVHFIDQRRGHEPEVGIPDADVPANGTRFHRRKDAGPDGELAEALIKAPIVTRG